MKVNCCEKNTFHSFFVFSLQKNEKFKKKSNGNYRPDVIYTTKINNGLTKYPSRQAIK
jgi:hypothetical protein